MKIYASYVGLHYEELLGLYKLLEIYLYNYFTNENFYLTNVDGGLSILCLCCHNSRLMLGS